MYKSTEKRIAEIRALVDEYYEPGRQDRCKTWVWRNIVYPRYGISLVTFFRYLGSTESPEGDDQLSLF